MLANQSPRLFGCVSARHDPGCTGIVLPQLPWQTTPQEGPRELPHYRTVIPRLPSMPRREISLESGCDEHLRFLAAPQISGRPYRTISTIHVDGDGVERIGIVVEVMVWTMITQDYGCSAQRMIWSLIIYLYHQLTYCSFHCSICQQPSIFDYARPALGSGL